MKNKIVLSLAAILTISSLSAADLLKDVKVDISDSVRYTAEDDSNKNLNATSINTSKSFIYFYFYIIYIFSYIIKFRQYSYFFIINS